MKYTLEIGVSQHPTERIFERMFAEGIEKKLHALGVPTKRCDTDANIVNGIWTFEGILEDHRRIPNLASTTETLAGEERMLSYMAISTRDCIMGTPHAPRTYGLRYDEEAVLMNLNNRSTLLFTMCKRTKKFHPWLVAENFQRLAEWFTILTTQFAATQEGYHALVSHRRYTDAKRKFVELENLTLRACEFPPMLPA